MDDGEWLEGAMQSMGRPQTSPLSLKEQYGNSTFRLPLTKSQEKRRCKFGTLSAPLLPAQHSHDVSTWYSTTSSAHDGFVSQGRALWKPLASTWRDWETDEFGPLRKNADEGKVWINGTVPHWKKASGLRKQSVLEHELTWAWYRMCRHAKHPQRDAVGDPHLPHDQVVNKMSHGTKNMFCFWRDLKPPFQVIEVRRLHNEPEAGQHVDGDMFEVEYQCAIDYVSERLWNEKSDAGTFDNRIHSTALIRIPNGFPKRRPISLISWGKPSLNWIPPDDRDELVDAPKPRIDPGVWMPIADELGCRAKDPRFAKIRRAVTNCKSHHEIKVNPLEKLMLGPHASLARLAKCTESVAGAPGTDSGEMAISDLRRPPQAFKPPAPTDSAVQKKKMRHHRVFTAAAGFVKYAG